MKNIIIIAFLLISVSVFAQSAGPEHTFPNTSFYETKLSETQMQAFAKRAQQKLQDFGAALAIIGDTEYTLSMREKSKNAALKLFDNEKVNIKTTKFPSPQKNSSVQDYLAHLLQNPQKMSLQDIQLLSPFRKTSANLYQTNYQFVWLLGNKKYTFAATISLKKTIKNFGTEKKEVWEILIQEIREL